MHTTETTEARPVGRRFHPITTARYRLPVALAAGAVAGVIVGLRFSVAFGVLSGWLVSALFINVWTWATIWRLDEAGTRAHVAQDDPGRRIGGAMSLLCSVASLGAIGYLLVQRQPTPALVIVTAALCVAAVALSWITVHTVFTVRYAHLYYEDPEGGIDFNQDAPPQYSDFAYFAFTIGMSYAVSDTNVGQTGIRRLAMQQALLSYLLGVVVIGATINLLVSLPG